MAPFKFRIRNPLARSALTASATSTQPFEDSVISANNWGGFSRTAAELSAQLDEELQALDIKKFNGHRDSKKVELRRKAERFQNATFTRWRSPGWQCDADTARLIDPAADFSETVYRRGFVPVDSQSYGLDHIYSTQPSRNGTIKAMDIHRVISFDLTSQRKTVLVIAIRGSASFVDWVVNLNGEGIDASDIIGIDGQDSINNPKGPSLEAHRGFINSAKVLVPIVAEVLQSTYRSALDDDDDIDILFTGHSAGGAVAAILYAHVLTQGPFTYPFLDLTRTRLSCITFGAPPIFSRDVSSMIREATRRFHQPTIALSLVNEGDPIPRMDLAYAQTLVRLLASPDDDPFPFHEQNKADYGTLNHVFPLPPLKLYPVGEIILLGDARSSEDSSLDLRANVLNHQDLAFCLFSNLLAHPMCIYRSLAMELASAVVVQSMAPSMVEG